MTTLTLFTDDKHETRVARARARKRRTRSRNRSLDAMVTRAAQARHRLLDAELDLRMHRAH